MASAIATVATGNAARPSRAPIIGASSIAAIAASGVQKINSPNCPSSTPSIALRSGNTAANVPQTTPITAKAARAGRTVDSSGNIGGPSVRSPSASPPTPARQGGAAQQGVSQIVVQRG